MRRLPPWRNPMQTRPDQTRPATNYHVKVKIAFGPELHPHPISLPQIACSLLVLSPSSDNWMCLPEVCMRGEAQQRTRDCRFADTGQTMEHHRDSAARLGAANPRSHMLRWCVVCSSSRGVVWGGGRATVSPSQQPPRKQPLRKHMAPRLPHCSMLRRDKGVLCSVSPTQMGPGSRYCPPSRPLRLSRNAGRRAHKRRHTPRHSRSTSRAAPPSSFRALHYVSPSRHQQSFPARVRPVILQGWDMARGAPGASTR